MTVLNNNSNTQKQISLLLPIRTFLFAHSLFAGYLLLLPKMQITNPRERDDSKWKSNAQTVEKMLAKMVNQQSITIRTYCEFADMMLDAPQEYFTNQKNSNAVQLLTKPNINYDLKNLKGKQEEKEESGRRIMGVMNYAWDYLIRMIKNKLNRQNSSESEDLQFAQENIKLQMARIQQMLDDLSSNKYRWQNYTKDDQVEQNMLNKQMKEELIFIKLLQNLLKGQINKIKEGFQKHIEVAHPDNVDVIQVPAETLASTNKQKQIPINEVVKVKEYFQNKMKKMKSQQNTTIDPITRYQQQRKFNISVVRYYMKADKTSA